MRLDIIAKNKSKADFAPKLKTAPRNAALKQSVTKLLEIGL